MRIIDFHTHTFPEKVAPVAVSSLYAYCKIPNRSTGGEEGLLKRAQAEGVELVVNHPVCTNPAKMESLNRFAEGIAATDGMASFGCVHPDNPNWRQEIKTFRSRGLIGLKIHNDYQGFRFDSKQCLDLIDAAYAEGLAVLVHAGADPVSPHMTRCTPKMIHYAMPLLRQGRFIAAHMGGHLMLDDAMKYVIGSDVYIDTSMAAMYYSDEKCCQAILAHDPNRIIFGSDSPWDDSASAADGIIRMGLGDELTEKILYKNALSLLER